MPMTCFKFFYCQLFLPWYSFVVKIIYALLCLLMTYMASFLSFAFKLYGTSTIYFTYLLHWLTRFKEKVFRIAGRIGHLTTCMQLGKISRIVGRIGPLTTCLQLDSIYREVSQIAGRIGPLTTCMQLGRISRIAGRIGPQTTYRNSKPKIKHPFLLFPSMFICTHSHTHIHQYLSILTHTHMHAYTHIHTYIYTHTHTHTLTQARLLK